MVSKIESLKSKPQWSCVKNRDNLPRNGSSFQNKRNLELNPISTLNDSSQMVEDATLLNGSSNVSHKTIIATEC